MLLFSCQVVSSFSRPPWTAACLTSLSLTASQSLPKFTSIESVMPSNHFILMSWYVYINIYLFKFYFTFLLTPLVLKSHHKFLNCKFWIMPETIPCCAPHRMFATKKYCTPLFKILQSTYHERWDPPWPLVLVLILLYRPLKLTSIPLIDSKAYQLWSSLPHFISCLYNTSYSSLSNCLSLCICKRE